MTDDPDEDFLADADGVIPPPARRGRGPEDHVARIKADGMRLDQYLHMHYPDFSRSDLQEGIREGNITVNGKASKPSYKVRNDDNIRLVFPEPTYDLPVPEDIPLDILYEDADLAVINKPPNMVVHPAKGNWGGTLVNALQFHFKDQLSSANGSLRPGIVHRLDKDTSGAILVAKADGVHRDLGMQFETRKVFKEYVAIACGELDRDSDYIDAAIKNHPHDRLKMMVSTDDDAKPATSYYEVMERFRGYTLVKFQPKTGRTHQIRVHLAHIGCPVLADKLYGGRESFKLSDAAGANLTTPDEVLISRQALHAFRLRFRHPSKGTWIEIEAPLPADMRAALDALRAHRTVKRAL